jgi:hypothetical protein
MKKKVFIAMAVAAAMAAMPVAAGAAGSSHDSSSSSSTTTSNSGATNNAGVASGATVVSSQPTVQVTESGAKVTVAGATKDATGTTIGLVGESAGNGAVKSGDVTVGVATGAAETAGLPDAVVSTIKALNTSANLSNTLPGLGLDGFSKVGGTRAIVAKNAAGADVPTAVSMFVDKLPANATVTVVCFNNATGQWMTITNVTVDAATKTVNFTVPGSCTVQIAVK